MPQPMEIPNLAKYMSEMEVLAERVQDEYYLAARALTSDAEMRGLRNTIIEQVIAEHKSKQRPYLITWFRDTISKCSEPNCYIPIKGVYQEVSNPVTNKNIMLNMETYHNIVHHQIPGYDEKLLNMGNAPFGEVEVLLKCGELLKVLEKSDCPPEAIGELQTIKVEIDRIEAEKQKGRYEPPPIAEDYWDPTPYEVENGIIPFKLLMKKMVAWGAEDIHIKPEFRPLGVIRGNVEPSPDFPDFLTPKVVKYYAWSLMSEAQQHQFEDTREMDLSFEVRTVARFRCNIYWSLGVVGMVLRVIPTQIRPCEVLGVPKVLKKVVFERLGLVLVTGQTGSGKTTTLAALLEFANMNRKIHILTLENPVEYVYEAKKAIFTQRAIEIDSLDFTNAMRGALRQKPDIILIGEMRDKETITVGLKAAETGILVVSTLHTSDAPQTIARLVNTFPPHEQETVRVQLANVIKAVISQRLAPRQDKPGRVCSIEIMLITPNARGMNTREYISSGQIKELYKVIATSGYDGMQSNNASLFEHYRNCVTSPEDALALSDNPEELIRWMRELSREAPPPKREGAPQREGAPAGGGAESGGVKMRSGDRVTQKPAGSE